MPAVTAIATAPQATTRTVARRRGAPPSRAPMSPSSASAISVTRRPRRPAPPPASPRRPAAAAPHPPRTTAPTSTRPGTAAPPLLFEAQLVARMRPQRAAARQGLRHLARQRRGQAPLLVDPGELSQLAIRVAAKLALLQADVGLLGVALRADRHVLAGGHRQRPGHQPGDPGGDDRSTRRAGSGHAEHEARGRQDAVVGAKHRGPQPVRSVAEVNREVRCQSAHAAQTVSAVPSPCPR